MLAKDVMLMCGNATSHLAARISEFLAIPLSEVSVGRFSDGETQVELDENVRGRDVFVIQSTCSPANDNLMELLLIADALRRASAARVTAVMPYFGYSRQDRRAHSKRVPISAKVVADMLTAAGIDRVLTVDLHSEQIQGFFHIPVDNVYATPLYVRDIQRSGQSNVMVVSPDVGGVVRARAFAKEVNAEMAIIDKRRPGPNQSQVMNIIGDVDGANTIIVDDMVDTAGTLCTAAKALKDAGASSVRAYCTHAVLSGPALDNIAKSALDELVVTDSIPLGEQAQQLKTIRTISMAKMLSEAIRRVAAEESVSRLFTADVY